MPRLRQISHKLMQKSMIGREVRHFRLKLVQKSNIGRVLSGLKLRVSRVGVYV